MKTTLVAAMHMYSFSNDQCEGFIERQQKQPSPRKKSSRGTWNSSYRYFVYFTCLSYLTAHQFRFHRRLLQEEYEERNDSAVVSALVNHEQSRQRLRYFVLDDPDIMRTDIRKNVLLNVNATWNYEWGHRFRDEYAAWEVRFLQALEHHPDRTYDTEQADYFVIPMPVGGIMTHGTRQDLRRATNAIADHPIFKAYADKFVLISLIEFIFVPGGKEKQAWKVSGWSRKRYKILENITVAQDIDVFAWNAFKERFPFTDWGPPFETDRISFTKNSWSLGYSGAASDPSLDLVIPTYETFVKRTYQIFYHTTESSSLFNSTKYRHAPILHANSLPQPSSVGFDITKADWKNHFMDSKFCLVIRGDNPTSRALWRTIRQGCIPLIVSDALPYYAPCMRSQISMKQYAIFIPEQDFLDDPAGSIRRAIHLTERQLREKIRHLAMFQSMIIVDHPKSQFVSAFGRETIASWSRQQQQQSIDVALEPETAQS